MSETLTPGRLADRLQGKIDLDTKTTGQLSTELFSIITRELKKEESISLFGFGTFKRIPVPISKGRNPQTGEEIVIPAHFRVKFSPAAKVAERINAEYAHLKPLILEEEKKHEGLLLKAERYVLSIKADPEPPSEMPTEKTSDEQAATQIPTAVSAENAVTDEVNNSIETKETEQPATETKYPEPDFGFEKDRKLSSQKKSLMLLGGLVLLLGMGWIVLDRNSEDEITGISVSREATEAVARPANTASPAVQTESSAVTISPEPRAIDRTPSPPPEPPVQSAVTEYSIARGDSFSLLARDKWGSIHLWPYLYAYNRNSFSDPDLIRPGDSILFPPKPEIEKDQHKIEESIMAAYERYRSLITERPDSPRNLNREISSGYVLLGGEILYPGFMERRKQSLRIEDIRRAEELMR